MRGEFSWEAFNKIPVVGILRGIPQKEVEIVAERYFEAGLTTLEITMNSEEAESTITALVKTFGNTKNIGAGTVCTLEDLDKALSAGARFIVTPIITESVISACVENKIPVFPGAYTPSEIYKAWSLGADMVKVFPATKLGPEYIREVLGPLNNIKLMPTGGISLENFTDFLKAGASGLGVGSLLFPMHLIQNKQWDELGKLLSAFTEKYNQYKLNKN